MIRGFLAFLIVVLGLAGLGFYLSAFIVRETNQAIQLRFGKPQDVITEAGLYWKIPLVDEIRYFDKRILDLDLEPKTVYTIQQKQVIVDAYARWKITDSLEFLKAVQTERNAVERLGTLLEAALRGVVSKDSLEALVRDKRNQMMVEISNIVNDEARGLGIQVVDVRIKRADLPEENAAAVFARMETERKELASKFRAEGQAESNRIRADADRQSTIILAEAEKQSQVLRGEADAERNSIFASAFGQDPQFFSFYRSMQAYERSLSSGDTRLVISPNSEFFRYFGNIQGRQPGSGQAGSASPAGN